MGTCQIGHNYSTQLILRRACFKPVGIVHSWHQSYNMVVHSAICIVPCAECAKKKQCIRLLITSEQYADT